MRNLELRSKILWKIRQFFHHAGFWEVQTPTLSADTVVDRYIDPVQVSGRCLGLSNWKLNQSTLYLQTSPEFAMKRLLAAGAPRIYQICPVFRSGERGRNHNPEFTMLEWYRVGDDLMEATQLLCELVQAVLPGSAPIRLTYAQAFREHCGFCPLEASVQQLAKSSEKHNLAIDRDWSGQKDEWLNLLFSEVVQPKLGHDHPTILTHYPASQAALARLSQEDSRVAERFELFIDGIELANGYHELLDATELEKRNDHVSLQRQQDAKDALVSQGRMLDAMRSGLPNCSGCALGVDRLLMVLAKTDSIDDVLAFPIERA